MTINHHTAIARKVFKMKTDAPDADSLIQFADSLMREINGTEYGIDSLDLGDAFGAFISLAESEEYSGNDTGEYIWVSPAGFTVTISQDWDLFEWGVNLPPNPLMISPTGGLLTKEEIEDAIRKNGDESE